jgi:CubicO group peptidase (beta-lactamase class C family)
MCSDLKHEMRRRRSTVAIGIVLAIVLVLTFFFGRALRVATGFTSQTLCSETFVGQLDPDRTFAEVIRPMPELRYLAPLIHYTVDREQRAATATVVGLFASRAVYRDGYGCRLDYAAADDTAASISPAPAKPSDEEEGPVVAPTDPVLQAALDRAFAEPKGGPRRATRAVVIVHDDHVIAERYAPGFGVDTPLLSWSVAKSVINAMIGILVRDGRLSLDGPAPIPAWRDSSDPRHDITIEELMRMTSGLALDETDTGFDPSSRMLFTEPDMAGFAERAPLIAIPGTRWHYSSPSVLILSRIIRDAVGGHAEDVLAFARRELFAPLDMRNVTMEFDQTGTPVGSSYIYATARDWARFGLLYANDGMVGGRRILPEGWLRFSAAPTPGSSEGYAAGFLTNLGEAKFAQSRVQNGMPTDSIMAAGILGQWIVIAPAQHLVIVRFGATQDWPAFDIQGLVRLVTDANEAVGAK